MTGVVSEIIEQQVFIELQSSQMIVFAGEQGPAGTYSGGSTGGLLAANNLSDLANTITARTNLGLGDAAVHAASYFALSAHVGSGGAQHANAVAAGAAGFMTGADKTKLDGIAAGAFALPDNTGHGGEFLQSDGLWSGVTQRQIITLTSNAASATIDDTGIHIFDISGVLSAQGNFTITLTNPTKACLVLFDNDATGGYAVVVNSTYTIPSNRSFWYYDGSVFEQITGDDLYVPVARTVAGHALTSNVTLVKTDVGLGNVDNTSDATKNAASVTLTNHTISNANNTLTIGANQDCSGYRFTNAGDPVSAQDYTTRNYVDLAVSGVLNRLTATVATTAALPAFTYNNGASGVGATITANAVGVLTVDSNATVLNDVILVKNETGGNRPYIGVYTVTTQGTAGVAFVLTRVTGLDQTTEFGGAGVFISSGTNNAATSWICTTASPTVGTTNIVFVQASASISYSNGYGLGLSGTVFSVDHATIPYKSDNLSVFGITTPAQLAGIISGTTGTGNLVFDTSPTFTTPALGTPSALVATNATGTAPGLTAGNVTTNANLTGDVTSSGNAATVAFVGGSAASVVHTAELLANAATNANTASAIVKRDSSGNFVAGTITATLNGSASTVVTNANLTGPITSSGNATSIANSIDLPGSPTTTTQSANDNSTKLATTAYVDSALTTFNTKPDVAYCATSALPANTYSNGSSGVGATLTGNSNGPLIIDSVTILVGQVGERILVAGEAAPANNGWYIITQQGVVAVSPYILTRAVESDQAAEIGAGYLTGVVAPNTVTPGTANNGKLFISVAADPFTVGTTGLTFSQVGSTYSAGNGLTLSGTSFTINTAITADLSTAQTLTNKTVQPRVSSNSNQTSLSVNADNFDIVQDTGLTGAVTVNNPTGTPYHGQILIYEFTGTASRVIAWGNLFAASTVALPATTAGTAMLQVGLVYDSAAAKYVCRGVA